MSYFLASTRSLSAYALTALTAAALLSLILAPAKQARAHGDPAPLTGHVLKMKDSTAKPNKRMFLFKTKDQLGINEFLEDLTGTVSNLVVRSSGANGSSSGMVYLNPSKWRVIGDIGDPKGWKYKNDWRYLASGGVAKIMIKDGPAGGRMVVKAKGPFWDFNLIGPQDSIEMGIRLGDELYCAEYDATTADFRKNAAGKVKAKAAPAPSACPTVCGNGAVELGEVCDDGNQVDADTCANDCSVPCQEANTDYSSTFEALQGLIFDSPTYQCSNDLCHGSAVQGGLDLRAPSSWTNLVNVPSQADSSTVRVFPGDQDLSMLYLKIAAKTLGTVSAPGSPMPTNASTVDANLLEALRLWIRGGAPETGVVVATAELLDTCLPPPSPNKTPQPDPPAFGQGAQFSLPGFPVSPMDEDEACVATYYDLTVPGAVPPEFRLPCPGSFPGTNDHGDSPGECFAYNSQAYAMDAQSHHLILHIYSGAYDQGNPGWGAWTCFLGDNAGQACDPTQADPCPGGGTCGSEPRTGFACLTQPAFGPPDYGFGLANAPMFGGIQEPTTTIAFAPGVYSLLPLKGIIVWNTHRFNLSSEPADVEGWVNIDFTNDQQFASKMLFDTDYIFTNDMPPFTTKEYCATTTFPEGAVLTDLNSHMHFWGRRFRTFQPPQTPCPRGGPDPWNFFYRTDPNCTPGDPADMIYESFDYTDPLQLKLSPPMVMSGTTADRTIKWCAFFDHAVANPAEVKRYSASPEPPVATMPGGPCDWDKTKCIGGPNQGQYCFLDDNNCPNGECDACDLLGGVTAGDEMFIVFGQYYQP